jgi:hypothetical protein
MLHLVAYVFIFMRKYFSTFILFLGVISTVSADVQITEVMYDPKAGGEWVEIYNPSDSPVDLKGWKLFDGTNHNISVSAVVPAGGYLILADDKNSFISAFNDVSITIIDIVTSMNNDGDTVILRNPSNVDVSTVSYTASAGASKNEKSLQLISGEYLAWFTSIGTASVVTKEEVLAATPAVSSIPTASNQTSTSNSQTSSPYHAWPSDMQIYVSAGGDKISVAGADVVFEGKALSASRKTLPNADLIWTFGDGGSDRGTQVRHTFHHPGRYVVLLDVISGDYIAKDQIFVEVVTPKIRISNVATGTKSFIELHNETIYDLDFGGFVLSGDGLVGAHFKIPKNTIVLAGRKIIFPSEITKINGKMSLPELRFGNSELIAQYVPGVDTKESTTEAALAPSGESAPEASQEDEQDSFVQKVSQSVLKPIFSNLFQNQDLEEVATSTSTTSVDIQGAIDTPITSAPQVAAVGVTNIKFQYAALLALIMLAGVGALLFLQHLENKERLELGITNEIDEIRIIE